MSGQPHRCHGGCPPIRAQDVERVVRVLNTHRLSVVGFVAYGNHPSAVGASHTDRSTVFRIGLGALCVNGNSWARK
ncbi:MAG: hypothetical protein ABI360_06925 [Allobranchiibius sp.]